MRRLITAVVLVGAMLLPGTAYADHAYDDGGYYQRDGCGESGGGCGNEREEQYGDNSCKYVCPAFDKSPVQDSFNLQICVMPGSCAAQPEKDKPEK